MGIMTETSEGIRRLKVAARWVGIATGLVIVLIAIGRNALGLPELFVGAIAGFAAYGILRGVVWIVAGFAVKKPD